MYAEGNQGLRYANIFLRYWKEILALNTFMKAGVIMLLNESWLLKYSIINFFVFVEVVVSNFPRTHALRFTSTYENDNMLTHKND